MGSTVMVMATRGDADMEAAALSSWLRMPLAGLIYADHQHAPRRCAG